MKTKLNTQKELLDKINDDLLEELISLNKKMILEAGAEKFEDAGSTQQLIRLTIKQGSSALAAFGEMDILQVTEVIENNNKFIFDSLQAAQ